MISWEYCELDFDGITTQAWFYDEAGDYIEQPATHTRLGVLLSKLGHDGWELISTWWRSDKRDTYMLKRQCQVEWTETDRRLAQEKYEKNHPRDKKF